MIGGGARSSRACPVMSQQHAVFFPLWFWTVDSGMMATGPVNPNIQALSSALAVVIAQHASPPSTQPSGATTQPSPTLSGASTDGSAGSSSGSAPNRYVCS